MTTLNDNNVPPFLSIPFSLQQRDTTISTATKEITQLTCQFMERLNERSTALANAAQFQLALRDAAYMRVLNPTSSLGYLKAGTIYQQQGRQQKAAAMYEKGLTNVPSSDECYADLQMQHVQAVNACSKRIDFISQLPLDLVTLEILPLVFHNHKLQDDEPCPYLYVSRTWRQRILQCNNLSFDTSCNKASNQFEFRELRRFSAHVKTLFIEARTAHCTDLDPLFNFVRGDFRNLTNLSMLYHGVDQNDIGCALHTVGKTLTHLDLCIAYAHTPGDHLNLALHLCPSLVSFKLATWTTVNLTVEHPKLTHLTLSIQGGQLSHDTMTNILSHLPALVFFDVPIVPYTHFLSNLIGYCPNMKLLKCGGCHTFDDDKYDRHVGGLQKLSFGFSDVYRLSNGLALYNADALISLLLENKHSLDHIILAGRMTGKNLTLQERSLESSLVFSRLEELEIDAFNDELATLATAIIRRSPYLQRLTIGVHAAVNHDDLSNAMNGLNNLGMFSAKKLTRDSTWFYNILQHHVQRGRDSPLKELKLAIDSHLSPSSWEYVVGGLQSVQDLVISTASTPTIPSNFYSIATIINACTSLSYLELDFGYYSAPESFISRINDHPTLQRLKVHASSIAVQDIVNISSFTSLKHIIIIARVEEYLITSLRKHIPRVDYSHY